MPPNNQFAHQDYFASRSSTSYRLVQPQAPPPVESSAFEQAMSVAGRSLDEACVADIYLVHGTIAGTDATGLHRAIFGLLPGLGAQMHSLRKQVVDAIFGDTGNYTDEFVTAFRSGIRSAAPRTRIHRFLWSGENHHLGRADAAVQLIDELSQLNLQAGHRVMLWGHSHAGNVFALLTNLVGSDPATRRLFLDATQDFQPHGAAERWARVRRLLAENNDRPLCQMPIDIVTFGTPIRYGWETRGYDRLLHVINHHVIDAKDPIGLPFPPSAEQILSAATGDYFQQMFIAGTDLPPNPLAFRTRQLNRKLVAVVQREVGGALLERLQQGVRVPEEGLTLLVDYAAASPSDARSLAGHGVYTRLDWLPFHLTQVVENFYQATDLSSSDLSNSD